MDRDHVLFDMDPGGHGPWSTEGPVFPRLWTFGLHADARFGVAT